MPLTLLMTRRSALLALGSAIGGAFVVACAAPASSGPDAATPGTDGPTGDGTPGACATTADETAGPYPDTKNMVGTPGTYRSDVREDRTGVPLTVTLKIVDAANGCAAIAGAHVEIWHCDASGVYSEYANAMNAGSTAATYLRGVQTTDAAGNVTFTTIYPGWYQGRATHIHIQVYNGTAARKTTQLAFPEATNQAVYGGAAPDYKKGQNSTTNASDMVFGDGDATELATVTGSVAAGYAAALQIGVTGY